MIAFLGSIKMFARIRDNITSKVLRLIPRNFDAITRSLRKMEFTFRRYGKMKTVYLSYLRAKETISLHRFKSSGIW